MAQITAGQAALGIVIVSAAVAFCVLNDWWNRRLQRRNESRRGFEIRATAQIEPPQAPAVPERAPQPAATPGVPSGWSHARAVVRAVLTGNVRLTRPDGTLTAECPRCRGPVTIVSAGVRPDVDPTLTCPGCGEKITVTSVPLLGKRPQA
jgi:hypothetical protein